MQGVMAGQSLILQARERLPDLFLTKGKLVLDHDVNDRVELGVGQADLLLAMVGRDELDALPFVHLQPVSGEA